MRRITLFFMAVLGFSVYARNPFEYYVVRKKRPEIVARALVNGQQYSFVRNNQGIACRKKGCNKKTLQLGES